MTTTTKTPERIAQDTVEQITAPEYKGYQTMTATDAKNLLYTVILNGLSEAVKIGEARERERCLRILRDRAAEWRRKNVDESPTNYKKKMTWVKGHEADACADAIRPLPEPGEKKT